MNGNEMRRVLADEIYKLRAGKSKPDRVNAVARAAATICASIRVELQYCNMTGQQPSISFIGGGKPALPKPKPKAKSGGKLRAVA